MRFLRWLPTILLVLLVALPAFPPLIEVALKEVFKAVGFQGSWNSVGGYLLTGVEVRGAKIKGNGLELEADRLWVGYNLLSLLKKELPLRIQAHSGTAKLGWDTVIPTQPQPQATPRPFQLRIDELLLDNISVELKNHPKFPLPTMRAKIKGFGPSYQVALQLPDGNLQATVRRTGKEFEAWTVDAVGDLRAARYWYSDIESGKLEGHWKIGPKVGKSGVLGSNRIKNATVKIVGFTLTEVYGPLEFDGTTVTANLVGQGLDSPVKGYATVDIPNREYRFRVEGRPTLPALAANYKLTLPVEGSGPLVLEGKGWEKITLSGRFGGQGRLLNEPLTYNGTLAFENGIFRLGATANGAIFDRTFQSQVVARTEQGALNYTVNLLDIFGSKLRLDGRGSNTTGTGTLVLPKPLIGEAKVKFSSIGSRWTAGFDSKEVGLPAAKPFDLSGNLQGEGDRVKGQLGAVNLSGTWTNLAMDLSRLELVLGEVGGRAALRNGKFSAALNYQSPYTSFPVTVLQDKNIWRLRNEWAKGSFSNGVFDLIIQELPLQVAEAFKLSGNLRYAKNKLGGLWNLSSEHSRIGGELQDLSARYTGTVFTPLGNLPLTGTANSSGVFARLKTLDVSVTGKEGVLFRGPLDLGLVKLEANLGLKNSQWIGKTQFKTQWLSGTISGRGTTLWADAEGYARLSGPVWPKTTLSGRLTLPLRGFVEVPEIPITADLKTVRWDKGQVLLKSGLPFEGTLPILLNKEKATLEAKGDIQRGSLKLRSALGEAQGQGEWRNFQTAANLRYAGYDASFDGFIDLFKLSYQGRVEIPKLEGTAEVKGRLTSLTYNASFQQGHLKATGSYDYKPGKDFQALLQGLRVQATADSYDLARWGLPAKVSGTWSDKGGRLRLNTQYGLVNATGTQLLGPLSVETNTQYGVVKGLVGLDLVNLSAQLDIPYLEGKVRITGTPQKLAASGAGIYKLPYLAEKPWRLSGDVFDQSWQLDGPLKLEGKGLAYSGSVNWPYSFQGRSAVVSGTLEGKSLDVSGNLNTEYGGIPVSATVQAKGLDLDKLTAQLSLPDGKAQIAHKQASFDVEATPFAQFFKVDVKGRLKGQLDLEAKGKVEGDVLAYGQKVEVSYLDRSISAFLPDYKVGVKFDLEQEPTFIGTGDLAGSLKFGKNLDGHVIYTVVGNKIEAQIAGTPEQPKADFAVTGNWGTAKGSGTYIIAKNQAQAAVNVETAYANGQFAVNSTGTKYQATGEAQSLQYLKQTGPAKISGDGTKWNLTWFAPVKLEASGNATKVERLRGVGQASLEVSGRKFTFDGDMAWSDQKFAGNVRAKSEQIDLELTGQGPQVLAKGLVYDAQVSATVNQEGVLGGDLSYQRDVYTNKLSANGKLLGTVFKPEVRGTGVLAGKGDSIGLSFGYQDQVVWAKAVGEGVQGGYRDGIVEINLDRNLEAFVGYPVNLKTKGSGTLQSLDLPIEVSGDFSGGKYRASGQMQPLKLTAQVEGNYAYPGYKPQNFAARYDKEVFATLKGPYASGDVQLNPADIFSPKGLLTLDLPVPGGRAVGTADLGKGKVDLEGRDGWEGTLSATLRQGWKDLTKWNVQSNLSGKLGTQGFNLKAKADVDASPLGFRGEGSVARLKVDSEGKLGAKDLQLDFSGDMALVKDNFVGTLVTKGDQIDLVLTGQGPVIRAKGTAYDVLVNAKVSKEGGLGGELAYSRAVYTNKLNLIANLSGNISKPVVTGTGELAGKGDAVRLTFGYQDQIWADATAQGLQASFRENKLQIEADRNLEAFIGYSINLKTSGTGTLDHLDLPVEVSGEVGGGRYHASGRMQPLELTTQLSGTYTLAGYEPQRVALSYDKVVNAVLSGPYASGDVQLNPADIFSPKGLLTLDLPVPGGRTVGTADLGKGKVDLEGRDGWEGTLSATLRQGWKDLNKWNVQSNLGGKLGQQAYNLKANGEVDVSPLAVRGTGTLSVPEWGQLALKAQGTTVVFNGLGDIEPLAGRVELTPLKGEWSYKGPLPKNLGNLEAKGTYPGIWASGTYQYPSFGPPLSVEGRDQELHFKGEGVEGVLTTQKVTAQLKDFMVGPVKVGGTVSGPFAALEGQLNWDAYGRKGEAAVSYANSKLEAKLAGDVSGDVALDQSWSGEVAFKEGTAKLSGKGIPQLEGSVFGFGVRLNYPELLVANSVEAFSQPTTVSTRQQNLNVDLRSRNVQGEMVVRNVEVRGKGQGLEATYPFAGGTLVANFDLQTLVGRLSAPSLGTGEMVYQQGQLSGEMQLALYGFDLGLQGDGTQIKVRASHPDSEWLPWKGGELNGTLQLDGGWKAHYSDAEDLQQVDLTGKLLDASLEASGKWATGKLSYNGKWQGKLNLDYPLEPLSSTVSLEVVGGDILTAKGKLDGVLGRVEVNSTLDQNRLRATAGFSNLLLEEVPLLSTRLPYLQGRANGTVQLDGGTVRFSATSPALKVKGDGLQLATKVSGAVDGGILNANVIFERSTVGQTLATSPDLSSNRTTATLKLEKGILKGEATAAAFPLHWLFSTWNGDLQGEAFWTGKAGFSLNMQDIWASKGTLVGEQLRFRGGGDELVGTSVLRFEQQRLYIDQLSLSGKGTWKGQGYWGRDGNDLKLDLENTTFTPVLQVIPQLRPYTPEGSGTIRVTSTGQEFDFSAENFKFRLGPVRAETPKVRLQIAENAVAEGHLTLTAPYPAEADLSGEGELSAFTIRAKGTTNVPLLSPNEPFDLSFTYPSYVLDGNLEQQNARLYGTLFPQLVLSLTGQVPVRYPSLYLLDGLVDSNLILVYDKGVYTIRGSADVVRARLGLPEGKSDVTLVAPADAQAKKDSSSPPVNFENVRIQGEKGILINESLAQGELKGDLFVNGDFSNPFLSGEVVPIRGSFKLWDRDFTVRDRSTTERSYARFVPSSGILPELQIVADTQVQDRTLDDTGKAFNQIVQVDLTLKGQFSRQNGRIKINLEPTFSVKTRAGETANKSNGKPYTDAEVYTLLLLGRTDLSALPADIAQTGIQAAIQNFIIGQLERELAKSLGLDQVRVEIPALSGGNIDETKFTIGRYLLPELYVAYAVDLRGYQSFYAEYQKDDYRLTSTSSFSPNLRQEFSLGYSIRPLGADLTFDFAAGDLSTGIGTTGRSDGVKIGFGITFRF